MSNFQSLEDVDRDSESQPQVVENLNLFTYQDQVDMLTLVLLGPYISGLTLVSLRPYSFKHVLDQ